MSIIDNERTKITAAAFNTVATSCVTVGVLAPLSVALYNFGQNAVPVPTIALGAAIWLAIGVLMHYNARYVLGRLVP